MQICKIKQRLSCILISHIQEFTLANILEIYFWMFLQDDEIILENRLKEIYWGLHIHLWVWSMGIRPVPLCLWELIVADPFFKHYWNVWYCIHESSICSGFLCSRKIISSTSHNIFQLCKLTIPYPFVLKQLNNKK